MGTMHTERTSYAPDARTARGATARWLHAIAGVLAALAAVLAFGLVGLLVVVWRWVRGTRHGEQSCRGCRRRRYLTFGVTSLLAALVLVGGGLSVHQSTSGPSLPTCRTTEQAAHVPGSSGVPPMEVAGGEAWSQTRQILTAPVSGLTRLYVDDRGGGLCEGKSMTVGFLPSAASGSGAAVGGVVLIDAKSRASAGDWEALAHHESRHVNQWAALTLAGGPLAMPVLYAVDDAFFPDSLNHFERAAGLEDGGYPGVDSWAPQPQWVDVTVFGLILLVVFRRRLRWASRVLIGGRAGAAARQGGLCPVHTKGWFRPASPTCLRPLSEDSSRDAAGVQLDEPAMDRARV